MRMSQMIVVKNMEESVDFYKRILGFELSDQHSKNEKGLLTYAMLVNGDCSFHIMPEGSHLRTSYPMKATNAKEGFSQFTSIYLDKDEEIKKVYEKALKEGISIPKEPSVCEHCHGFFIYLTDINGHLWYIASYEKAI